MTDLFGHERAPAAERMPLDGWPERPEGGFRLVLADPPWRYEMWSTKGEAKSPGAHYRCWPVEDIAAMPVAGLVAEDAALFLWSTWPMIESALQVMRAWGFRPNTGAAWAKQSPSGRTWAFGVGYVFRSASEPLLVGSRGRPRPLARDVRNLIVAPVREHSRKPDAVHGICERLYPGPRLELFARECRDGWRAWGDQLGRFG